MSRRRSVPPLLVVGTVMVVLGGAVHLAGSDSAGVALTLLGGLLVALAAAVVRPEARPRPRAVRPPVRSTAGAGARGRR